MQTEALLKSFPPENAFGGLLDLAVAEDLGGKGIEGDVTSALTIDPGRIGVGTVVQKGPGVACGLPIVEAICRRFDPALRVEFIPGFHLGLIECRYTESAGTPLVRIRGPMRSLLAAERTILNLLGRLSGVATLTRRFVRKIEGTAARIYDTRKTTPGLRALEKYAVRCGGGRNHRFGLHDRVLVKDNHLAAFGTEDLADAVAAIVDKARERSLPVEIEVDTFAQFEQAIGVDGVDVILLDNMDCPTMNRCVRLRDSLTPPAPARRVALEASGGVTLETVRDIALTGVDRIAVGALTHSAPAVDVGLDVEEQ